MNEEEKQAIEYIKNCLDNEYNFKNATRQKDKDAYNVILSLINKQQKEIENHTFNDKVVLETLKECVTKRSIRELIKEKAKTDTYNSKTIAVKDIEELLGETK